MHTTTRQSFGPYIRVHITENTSKINILNHLLKTTSQFYNVQQINKINFMTLFVKYLNYFCIEHRILLNH